MSCPSTQFLSFSRIAKKKGLNRFELTPVLYGVLRDQSQKDAIGDHVVLAFQIASAKVSRSRRVSRRPALKP
jgi:hypothetical protein